MRKIQFLDPSRPKLMTHLDKNSPKVPNNHHKLLRSRFVPQTLPVINGPRRKKGI